MIEACSKADRRGPAGRVPKALRRGAPLHHRTPGNVAVAEVGKTQGAALESEMEKEPGDGGGLQDVYMDPSLPRP